MAYQYENVVKKIHPEWLPFFTEHEKDLTNILESVNKINTIIYPNEKDLFRALFYHSPNDIKILIIGQDPYISEENGIPQAMGLSFSVPKTHKKIPPSLKNIFKEIKNCYPDYNIPIHGSLERWVNDERILLLNSALTVSAGKSNSQASIWTNFTDKLINWFQEKNTGCIFLLMGAFAQKKANFIDTKKHKIFSTIHPSPLSAYNGFFGCNVFKKINEYLETTNQEPINW